VKFSFLQKILIADFVYMYIENGLEKSGAFLFENKVKSMLIFRICFFNPTSGGNNKGEIQCYYYVSHQSTINRKLMEEHTVQK